MDQKGSDARARAGGFTIIEILVALTVLSIGFLGILALFPLSFERVQESAQETQASAIAQSFHAALITAFHNNHIDSETGNRWVTLRHAALENHGGSPDVGSTSGMYNFPLPPAPEEEDEIVGFAFPWPAGAEGNPNPWDHPDIEADPGWGYEGTGNPDMVGRVDPAHSTQAQYIWQFGQGDDQNRTSRLIRNVKLFDDTFDLDAYSVGILVERTGPEQIFRVEIDVYRYFEGRARFQPPYDPAEEGLRPELISQYRATIMAGS